METIEHFAQISLVARLLGGERLLSRAGSGPAAGAARDVRHRGAGADLPAGSALVADVLGDPASCQTVFAPETDGARLVPPESGGKFG